MSTMAEVIERFLSANYPCACEGDCPGEHAEAEELADALAKAGYGKLADARAAELEAAAEEADTMASVSSYSGSEDDMESLLNTATRLRARAAAIRDGHE